MELFIYLGKSAAILALFYVVYFFLLQKDTLFIAKRHFLLAGSLASLLLPLIEFTKVVYVEIPQIVATTASEIGSITHAVTQNEAIAINWWQLIIAVYCLGVIIMSVRFISQLFSLIKIISNSVSEKIGNNIHVKITEDMAPFSFFNYIVYNPSLHTEEELKMILKHEQIHTSQWHTFDILAANFLLIFQWINPFSWLYKSSIEENLEFIADSKTAQQVSSKKAYQLALVRASSTFTAPALTNNFYQSFTRLTVLGKEFIIGTSFGLIKKRIVMLNKNTSKKVNVLKLSIMLPLLALFLWSFNVKEVKKFKVNPSEASISENLELEKEIPIISEKVKKSNSEMKPIASLNVASKAKDNAAIEAPSEIQKQKRIIAENEIISRDEVYILITKNTTESDLKIHKKNLKKEHNIDFEYSNLKYNAAGELTSIAIKYSNNKGANGNYHVTEDGPIADFYFYISEDGHSGFGSSAMEERRMERTAQRSERMVQRMEERTHQMEERREKMEERREEMEVRREEMRDRMEHTRIRAEEESEKMHRTLVDIHGGEDDVIVTHHDNGIVSIHSQNDAPEHSIMIDKDTTDATLTILKKNLAKKGITFSYSRIKRNANGEITRIKMTTNNGKGHKSTVSESTDNGVPIKEILIGIL